MARTSAKVTLSPSRDIAFDRLRLSQSNIRRIKAGVSIEALADDIARRSLLQSLNVRPLLDQAGKPTGHYEIPAGGRRYRALELLVQQKRLSKTAPVPCIVQQAGESILAEEDSFAENALREPLHPLDQFRAMQAMVDKGSEVEAIAAHFMTSPAVVRQRLKLASVSPKLHEVYAEDAMTLDQLMAFTVSDDHVRQEQVWAMLAHSFNKSGAWIRQRLTENSVRVADKRVRFVTVEAYVAAGGAIVRDLFEPDDGGWLTDPALLDRLVDAKLQAEGQRIGEEGWKWAATAIDLPWNATIDMRHIAGTKIAMTEAEQMRLEALNAEADDLAALWSDAPEVPDEVHRRVEAIECEIGALSDRPLVFDAEDIAIAGAFVSIDISGAVNVERGFVRREDEPRTEGADGEEGAASGPGTEGEGTSGQSGADMGAPHALDGGDGDEGEEALKPLSDRIISDLTAWRTLALQNALAACPQTAFAAVLHALVLAAFYRNSRESCLQLSLAPVQFSNAPEGLGDMGPAKAIAARHDGWRGRLPQSEAMLWDALLELGADEQAELFAHCAALGLNAQAEIVPKYDNGRISRHSIARRIAHSDVIARAVSLDLTAAGWRPTAEGYFRSVTKPRILADVAEARGESFAQMIGHLKKTDMAREAERLLEDTGWLPEPLRTADDGAQPLGPGVTETQTASLPAFLEGEDPASGDAMPIAAE